MKELLMSSNVKMGPNATISWGQVTNQPFIPDTDFITTITEDTIMTTNVYARNLEVYSANIRGHITADSISAGAIDGETITGALIQTAQYPDRRTEFSSYGITSYDYRDYKHGFSLNTYGEFQLYNNDYLIGEIKYDTSGSGSQGEARERLFISTLRGYAMKLQASGDMSLDASNIWFAGNVYLPNRYGTVYVGDATLDYYIRSIVKEYI